MGDNAPSNTVKTYEAASVMPTVSGIAGASESPTPFSVYSAPARKPTESAQVIIDLLCKFQKACVLGVHF